MWSSDDSAKSSFFVPLRTNVGFFDNSTNSLLLLDRLKQASLLYDNLFLESGLYLAYVTETGVFDIWTPEAEIDMSELIGFRERQENTGGEFILSASSSPEEEYNTLLSGKLVRQFYCEFHNLFSSEQLEELDWIKFGSFAWDANSKRQARDITSFIRARLQTAPEEIGNVWLKNKMLANLGRDILGSLSLKSSVSMDSIYEPLIANYSEPASMITALETVIPNFSHLSWDVISDLRKEESLINFRSKLFEWEQIVRDSSNTGNSDAIYDQEDLYRVIIDELSRELLDLQPKVGEVIGDLVLDVMLGSIPYYSPVSTIVRGLGKIDQARQSWVNTFLKLRRL